MRRRGPSTHAYLLDHPSYYKHFLENPEDKNHVSWKAGSIPLAESWEAEGVGRTGVPGGVSC